MAELGIVAAAAQLLDNSIKVIFKLSWFCSEVRSTSEKLRGLQFELAQQTALSKSLLANLGAFSSVPGTGDLRPIVQGYNHLLDCLHQNLDRFATNENEGQIRRGLNTVRAFHDFPSKEEIRRLCDQLNDRRNLLSVWLGNMNLCEQASIYCAKRGCPSY